MFKKLIAHLKPKSPIAEAYRMLRTNITFSSIDKEVKSIVVTSSAPSEGKSTTMANLAVTIAQTGKQVLLLDCDLRKPSVHKNFGIVNLNGLTNIIVEHKDYKQCIQNVEINNLDIITSGPIPPNPSELLGSRRMDELIKMVTKDYDMVLIDAPPVGAVTDAAILSTKVDGTILVVSSGTTNIDLAQRAKQLLEKVNANIIGVVLNNISEQTVGSYYYNYYAYYQNDDSTLKRKKRKGRK